jgi:hypothetical protein
MGRHLIAETLTILAVSLFGVASGVAWNFFGMPHPNSFLGVVVVFLIPMALLEAAIIRKYRDIVPWLRFLKIDQDDVFSYFSVGFCAALLMSS